MASFPRAVPTRAAWSSRNAAGTTSPNRRLVFARASPAGPCAETKPCDIAVIGGCSTGLWAAWKLARAGKRVAVLGIDGAVGAAAGGLEAADVAPMLLPSSSPLLTHLAAEGAEMWRSLGVSAGRELLLGCGALEAELPPARSPADSPERLRDDEEPMLRLDRLAEACAQAGVESSMLTADMAMQLWGAVRLPRGARALYQPDGGVLLCNPAAGALRALVVRDGVDLRRESLQGFKDAGGYFRLRAGLGPTSSVIIEAEQLLLAPTPSEAELLLAMFGLGLSGLTVARVEHGQVPAGSDAEKIPLIRAASADEEAMAAGAGAGAAGTQDESDRARGLVYPRPPGTGRLRVSSWPEPVLDGGGALGKRSVAALLRTREEAEEAQEEELRATAGMGEEAEAQAEEPKEWALLMQAGHTAARLVRGVVAAAADADDCPADPRAQTCAASADGAPVLGSHPGWEEGQVVVALAATQADGGGGAHAGGTVGSLAAEMLLGIGLSAKVGASNLRSMDLMREALGTRDLELGIEPWEELPALQAAWVAQQRGRALQRQKRQEERRRAEAAEPTRKFFNL